MSILCGVVKKTFQCLPPYHRRSPAKSGLLLAPRNQRRLVQNTPDRIWEQAQ